MKIFILFLLTLTTALAQDFTFDKESGKAIPNYVAELKEMRGSVFKKSQGKMIKVKIGDRFQKSDTVITKDKSYIKLLVVDDTIFTLSSNSELNFTEFKFREKDDREAVYTFIKGQIRGIVKNKAKKEGDIKVRTTLAVMGIRGTEVLVNHQTLNNIEVSQFSLNSGIAIISNEEGLKQELAKHDKLTVVKDNSTHKKVQELGLLNDEEKKSLEDETTFLPYVNPGAINKDSELYSYFHGQGPLPEEAAPVERNRPKQKSLQHNLELLNEKLKKSHKR